MHDAWEALFDVLLLLLAALVLGAICEWFRQSAIIGYLVAGTLLGPNALQWVSSHDTVNVLAELGVAMLLFTIGLEFSWQRLRRMGTAALGAGVMQVLVTGALVTGIGMLFLPGRGAAALGAMMALSSTACVLRVLASRAQLESLHGRRSLAVLLVQDVFVVPLVLLVTFLANDGSAGQALGQVGWSMLQAVLLVGALYIIFKFIAPRMLQASSRTGNRELPILLAVVMGLGAAWGAEELHLSPALGAFVAGMLLGESPFATQIRADVTSLRTLLMTLFFSSVGMLAEPVWVFEHLPIVLAMVASILVGKGAIVWLILRFSGTTHRTALAAGLCLSQVGEFSFVLATVARQGGVIGDSLFRLVLAATILTLFVTPYLVTYALPLADAIGGVLERLGLIRALTTGAADDQQQRGGHTIIVGFGPAGQAVGRMLAEQKVPAVVVELNPAALKVARHIGLEAHLGDACHADVLEHVNIASAAAAVITLPDPAAARRTVEQIRILAPNLTIIARARYHVYRWELELAGAHHVVDEEENIGNRLAAQLRSTLRKEEPAGGSG